MDGCERHNGQERLLHLEVGEGTQLHLQLGGENRECILVLRPVVSCGEGQSVEHRARKPCKASAAQLRVWQFLSLLSAEGLEPHDREGQHY